MWYIIQCLQATVWDACCLVGLLFFFFCFLFSVLLSCGFRSPNLFCPPPTAPTSWLVCPYSILVFGSVTNASLRMKLTRKFCNLLELTQIVSSRGWNSVPTDSKELPGKLISNLALWFEIGVAVSLKCKSVVSMPWEGHLCSCVFTPLQYTPVCGVKMHHGVDAHELRVFNPYLYPPHINKKPKNRSAFREKSVWDSLTE